MKIRVFSAVGFSLPLASAIALMSGSTARAVDYSYGTTTGAFSITATDNARIQGVGLGTGNFGNHTGDMGIYWRTTASDATYMHFDLGSLAGGTIIGTVSLNQTVNAQYGGQINSGQISTANNTWVAMTGTAVPGATAIGDSSTITGSYTTNSIATWTLSNTTFQGFVDNPSTFYGLVLTGASGSTAHFSSTIKPTLTGTATTSAISVTGATDWSAAAFDSGTNILSLSGSNNVTGGNLIVRTGATLSVADTATLGSGNFAGTISNFGTLSLGSSTNQTLSGAISGNGTLVKSGSGTLTLTGANTYTGTTTVNGGTLVIDGQRYFGVGRTTTIASGATIELKNSDNNFNGSVMPASTINGSGTFRLSGNTVITQSTSGTSNRLTFAMTGGTIDLQDTARLVNGGWTILVWTNNKASLNLAAGAKFDFGDGNNVIIDALTGSGTVEKTWGGSGNNKTLTVGANNGSGNFSGSITNASGSIAMIKTGTGTQTLSGASSSYTGATTIQAGSLVAGTNSAVSSNGAFGNASSALVLGNGSTGATDAPTLLINGAYTVGRAITVGSVANTNAYKATIGGSNTSGTSTYSGAITLNSTAANYTTTLQAASGGTVDFTGTWTTNNKAIAIGSSGNTGTVKLSSNLSTTGGVNVNYGTLVVANGINVTTNLTVGANGAIGTNGGNGTLTGGLSILSGGNLDLTSATLGSNSSGILTLTGGNLTLGNLTFQDLVGWDWANAATGTYELIDGSFAINWGSTAYLSQGTAYDFGNGKAGYFQSGSLAAVVFAIPEPSAALLSGLGMLLLLRRRR